MLALKGSKFLNPFGEKMKQHITRRTPPVTKTTVVAALLAASAFALSATLSYAKTTVHVASAYGAEVNVGSVVKVGQIAGATLPSCATQAVGSVTASAASINTGLINSGLVESVASSTETSSTGSSEIVGVNLLGGIISTTQLKAVSTSSVDSKGVFHFATTGSTFGNLNILGIRIAENVAPNTVIDLPLIGSVTLNEQVPFVNSSEAKLSVNMIHVRITLSLLGFVPGTEVILGSAASEIRTLTGPAAVGGYAFAPELVTKLITIGPLVSEQIGCFGTGGAVETNSVAAVSIPGIINTGAVTVTGTGNINAGEASSEGTSSVAGLNLLSGLVSASVIKGEASATTTDGTNFDFNGGSTFVGISVAGHPEITATVAPNTTIKIANLGVLYLNRVTRYADKVRVAPVELIINVSNVLGIPIGADLTVGVVEAQLHSVDIP
jgi:hypothetical protein